MPCYFVTRVFTLGPRAQIGRRFCLQFMHAIVAFYSRDLCTVTFRDFGALRLLGPTARFRVAGLYSIHFLPKRCNRDTRFKQRPWETSQLLRCDPLT